MITNSHPTEPERIDPRREPERWVLNNQRITNEHDIDGWLALYAADAAIDYITSGPTIASRASRRSSNPRAS